MNDIQLLESYDFKFQEALRLGRLSTCDIQSSIDLFDFSDPQNPLPKQLSVVALISGRPFPPYVIDYILSLQRHLRKILGSSLHYLVKPTNLAVEHCVLKWPSDTLHKSLEEIQYNPSLITEFISKFYLQPCGVQFHADGCLILRCIDSNASIRNFRSKLAQSFPFIPSRQSSWAHIPWKNFILFQNMILIYLHHSAINRSYA